MASPEDFPNQLGSGGVGVAVGLVLTFLWRVVNRAIMSSEKRDERLAQLLGNRDKEFVDLRKQHEAAIRQAAEELGAKNVLTHRLADTEIRLQKAERRGEECEERERAYTARFREIEARLEKQSA